MPSATPSRARVLTVSVAGGPTLADRCAVADNPLTRMRGLLGRSGLESGEGLLIKPANSIHMFFMRFAIDALFLDADGVVVRVVHSLAPWKLAAARGAKSVIELPAGAAAAVSAGDRLVLEDGHA